MPETKEYNIDDFLDEEDLSGNDFKQMFESKGNISNQKSYNDYIKNIPLDKIVKLEDFNPRQIDEESEEFNIFKAKIIAENGITEPIKVCKPFKPYSEMEQYKGKFLIVDGETRYRVYRSWGKKDIPVVFLKIDNEYDFKNTMLTYGDKCGYTEMDIARSLKLRLETIDEEDFQKARKERNYETRLEYVVDTYYTVSVNGEVKREFAPHTAAELVTCLKYSDTFQKLIGKNKIGTREAARFFNAVNPSRKTQEAICKYYAENESNAKEMKNVLSVLKDELLAEREKSSYDKDTPIEIEEDFIEQTISARRELEEQAAKEEPDTKLKKYKFLAPYFSSEATDKVVERELPAMLSEFFHLQAKYAELKKDWDTYYPQILEIQRSTLTPSKTLVNNTDDVDDNDVDDEEFDNDYLEEEVEEEFDDEESYD